MKVNQKILMISLFTIAIYAFAIPVEANAANTSVLADNFNLKTVMRNLKSKDITTYTAKWNEKYSTSNGDSFRISLVVILVRSRESSFSYAWKDIYTRAGRTDLFVGLYLDGKKYFSWKALA